MINAHKMYRNDYPNPKDLGAFGMLNTAESFFRLKQYGAARYYSMLSRLFSRVFEGDESRKIYKSRADYIFQESLKHMIQEIIDLLRDCGLSIPKDDNSKRELIKLFSTHQRTLTELVGKFGDRIILEPRLLRN